MAETIHSLLPDETWSSASLTTELSNNWTPVDKTLFNFHKSYILKERFKEKKNSIGNQISF